MLFDVVPTIKFEDAFKLISMQPTNATAAVWERCGAEHSYTLCVKLLAIKENLHLLETFPVNALEDGTEDVSAILFDLILYCLTSNQTHNTLMSQGPAKVHIHCTVLCAGLN